MVLLLIQIYYKMGKTPLYYAAKNNDIECCKVYIHLIKV